MFSGALSAKRHFSWNFLLFACFRTLSEKKWGPLAKKLRKSFKWEIYVFRWLFEKANACCKQNTFLHFLTLGGESSGNWWKNFGSFFQKEFYVSRGKFCSKTFFRENYVFFSPFFDIELSGLRLCAETLLQESQKIDLETQQNILWKNFFLKLCSFVIFADIEFPSDFRRSFSTGLPKLYSECSVERYQQRDTFREISYFLQIFGLSVKKNEDRWRKSFARASNEKSMYLDDFLRKTTLVVRKTLSFIFELSEKKVWEIDEIISAVFSKENSTFPDKSVARKLFFRKYYVFFTVFRSCVICSPSLCWNFAVKISKIWSGNPTKNFVGDCFF